MSSHWLHLISYSPTTLTVAVDVRTDTKIRKYEYSVPEDIVRQFLCLYKHHQGRAFQLVKDNAFKSWEVLEDSSTREMRNG